MILPYFAVEWVEFFGAFTDNMYFTVENTDNMRFTKYLDFWQNIYIIPKYTERKKICIRKKLTTKRTEDEILQCIRLIKNI